MRVVCKLLYSEGIISAIPHVTEKSLSEEFTIRFDSRIFWFQSEHQRTHMMNRLGGEFKLQFTTRASLWLRNYELKELKTYYVNSSVVCVIFCNFKTHLNMGQPSHWKVLGNKPATAYPGRIFPSHIMQMLRWYLQTRPMDDSFNVFSENLSRFLEL